MNKGKLIIIESGSDGSGKATQTQLLYDNLKAEGKLVKKITYPNYNNPSSTLVKMYLSGEFGTNPSDVNAYASSVFFSIDRFASYNMEWKDFYRAGGIVISDRYTTSNMVHQSVKLEKEERDKYLDWLCDLEYNKFGLPEPDGVIFLDVKPEISQELIRGRANKITGQSQKDIHENDVEYLANAYKNSVYIAEKYNWIKIDCESKGALRSIGSISLEIRTKVAEMLSK